MSAPDIAHRYSALMNGRGLDMRVLLGYGFLLAGLLFPFAAKSQKSIWEEHGKKIQSSATVRGLGNDFFGDQVSLSNGALSFSVTDIAIPGNNELDVSLTRIYSVDDKADRYTDGFLADWDIDLPKISGVFAQNWSENRCAATTVSSARPADIDYGLIRFRYEDFWNGNVLSLPGGAGGELLLIDQGVNVPDAGGPYYWLTNDQTRVSCLGSIKNGTGQGFLAITADGTRYWFDWMAQYMEPALKASIVTYSEFLGKGVITKLQGRRKNVLYASRVEDRFGNWVDYTYANTWNEPGRLTGIASSDGRSISLAYNANGHLASASDGTRTWQYQYASVGGGNDRLLNTVILPDSSRWLIDFSGFQGATVEYQQPIPEDPWRSCTRHPFLTGPQEFSAVLTHPSGASGEFTVGVLQHSRSNVPVNCLNYTFPNNDETDDLSFWAISYHGLSLIKKRTTGPGLIPAEWNFSYGSTRSFYYPSGSASNPVCPANMDCSLPRCVSDGCAGSSYTTVTGPGGEWTRYRYGNSYRYNEGKLLTVERGSGLDNILRTEENWYDLSQATQTYPAKFGTSARARGEGFVSEYIRPRTISTVSQSGVIFTERVNTYDSLARPLSVIKSSTLPTEVAFIPTTAPVLSVLGSSANGAYSVSWSAIADGVTYQLMERINAGAWGQIQDGAATSKSVSGKVDGVHDYQVRGCNVAGCGPWSAISSVTVSIPPLAPPVPSTLQGYVDTEVIPRRLGASWPASPGATRYELRLKRGSVEPAVVYDGPNLSYVTTPSRNTSHVLWVRACTGASCSDWSLPLTLYAQWGIL